MPTRPILTPSMSRALQRAIIRDGDTFGVSEAERLQVRHVTSQRVAGLPVFLATMRAA
jgi:hypothetical protein